MKGILPDDEIIFPSDIFGVNVSVSLCYVLFKMLGCELKAFFISDDRNGKKKQGQQKPDRL